MCGIAGYKTDQEYDPKVLEAMVEAMRHRGPDSCGYFRGQGYAAGMRRLSIKDPERGDQPLYNEDKSVALVYNGEIYNYQLLKRELIKQGHAFRTDCDGEVICHMYAHHGPALFERLDGMFAAALWVEREKRLILARDLPGEKPLYYHLVSDREVAFASEIKALLRFPGLPRGLNLQSIWDLPTFLWPPEPDTIFQGVSALPRGHLMICDPQGITIKPYPNRHARPAGPMSDDEAIEQARLTVTGAVESRLMSDVPVGCFLSSGLDSSLIAALASRKVEGLRTFCVGFEDLSDPYHGHTDESAPAAEFAAMLGVEHHTIKVTADSFKKLLPDFCFYGDQPWAVSSGLGILAVAERARELGVKVLLSGDGADECFGGYWWYPYLGDGCQARRKPGQGTRGEVSFLDFGLGLEERLEIISSYPAPQRAWAWHYYAAEGEKARLFHPDLARRRRSSLRKFQAFDNRPDWPPERFIKQDREYYFPQEMLRKVDRMTMARSVEGRPPFASPKVLALADRLSYGQMVRGETGKWVLRRAFAGLLPPEVIKRPKHGFNVPLQHWLLDQWADLVHEHLGPDSALHRQGIVHKKCRETAWEMLKDQRRFNALTVFALIMLNMWLEMSADWR